MTTQMNSIQITGKNVEPGEAYKSYVTDKLAGSLAKYLGSDFSGHIRLEKERSLFRTDCSIRLRSGLVLEASGDAGDAYASVDAAVEHLEKRVRRHKRRLKSHHSGRNPSLNDMPARDYTVRADSEDESAGDHEPVIVAESERGIPELPVSEAVMQLDMANAAFLVFKNAAHGGLNIVYRRPDGHVGWIDPRPGGAAPPMNGAAYVRK
ncbi:MAG: ribosome hibernation-promoting factor, HPF/YfiA family [Hyphomicrobium sp.]